MPPLLITGTPQARYSPTLVGQLASLAKCGRMNDSAASKRWIRAGTCAGGSACSCTQSAGTPWRASAACNGAVALRVTSSRRLCGSRARTAANHATTSSGRYSSLSEPT